MVRIANSDILNILRANARTPFVKIAKAVGTSETAVRKKVRRLEEKGIIKKYTVELDTKKIGLPVQAIIGIDTQPEHLIGTIEKFKNMEDVIGLYAASGDHMILLEKWFENSAELAKFIQSLEKMKGVTKTCPAVILEKIK